MANCPMEMQCLDGLPTCETCRRGAPEASLTDGCPHWKAGKLARDCFYCREERERRTADAQPWVPAYAVTGELPPEPRSASATPLSTFSPSDCNHDHESNVLTEACLACIHEYAGDRRASAATTYEHCKGCLNEADCVARGCKMLHDEPRTSNAITEAWKKGHDAAMAVSRDDVVATWKTRALMAEAELERLDSGSAQSEEWRDPAVLFADAAEMVREVDESSMTVILADGAVATMTIQAAPCASATGGDSCEAPSSSPSPGSSSASPSGRSATASTTGDGPRSTPKASPARSSAYWGIAQSFLRSRYGKMVQEEDIDALEAVVASAARATVEECAEYLEGIHDDMSKTENARTLAPHFAHSLRAHVAGHSSCEERGSK